jgi:hypothetical protein
LRKNTKRGYWNLLLEKANDRWNKDRSTDEICYTLHKRYILGSGFGRKMKAMTRENAPTEMLGDFLLDLKHHRHER